MRQQQHHGAGRNPRHDVAGVDDPVDGGLDEPEELVVADSGRSEGVAGAGDIGCDQLRRQQGQCAAERMPGDEEGKRSAVVVPGLRTIENLPHHLFHRSSLGIDVLRERLQEAGMDPGLSLDRWDAPRIRQPVGSLLLGSAKGEHQVRRLVVDVPPAHESLGFSDIDDVQQGESGVREDVPERVQAQAPAAHQVRGELVQELTDVLTFGEIQLEGILHGVLDEAALPFELVVGEVRHLCEHVGHSIAVRGPHQRRCHEPRFGEVGASVACGRFGASDVGEDGGGHGDGRATCVRPVVADELSGEIDVACVHQCCPSDLGVEAITLRRVFPTGLIASRFLARIDLRRQWFAWRSVIVSYLDGFFDGIRKVPGNPVIPLSAVTTRGVVALHNRR